MRMLHAALLSLVAMLATVPSALAGDTGPVRAPDGSARVAKHRQDRKQLVELRFPTMEDLGPGWFLPWQAPQGMPSVVSSEARYWKRAEVPTAWAQFFGMSDEEIVAVARQGIDDGFAQMAAAGQSAADVPAELRSFITKPGALSMSMSEIRKFTLFAEQPQVLFAIENQDLANRVASEMMLEQDPSKREQIQARLGVEAIVRIGADLREKTYDQALAALAEEVRSVRRAAGMVYLSGDPEAWARVTSDRDIPDFGTFTVDLYVMAKEGTHAARGDLGAEDKQRIENRLSQALNGLMASVRSIAEAEAAKKTAKLDEQIQSYESSGRDATPLIEERVRVQDQLRVTQTMATPDVSFRTLPFGENAWVASMSGQLPGEAKPYVKYFGRLRNGNAVVNVTGEGTHPSAKMMEELEYMLSAMDAQTSVFSDE